MQDAEEKINQLDHDIAEEIGRRKGQSQQTERVYMLGGIIIFMLAMTIGIVLFR